MIPPGDDGGYAAAGASGAGAGGKKMIPPASGTNFGGQQGFYNSAGKGRRDLSSSKVVLALLGVSIAFLS